jgi:hypothetical protein
MGFLKEGYAIKDQKEYIVEINPYMADLKTIKASMLTKFGMLYININKKSDKVYIQIKKPSRLIISFKLDHKKLGVKSEDKIILC